MHLIAVNILKQEAPIIKARHWRKQLQLCRMGRLSRRFTSMAIPSANMCRALEWCKHLEATSARLFMKAVKG